MILNWLLWLKSVQTSKQNKVSYFILDMARVQHRYSFDGVFREDLYAFLNRSKKKESKKTEMFLTLKYQLKI